MLQIGYRIFIGVGKGIPFIYQLLLATLTSFALIQAVAGFIMYRLKFSPEEILHHEGMARREDQFIKRTEKTRIDKNTKARATYKLNK